MADKRVTMPDLLDAYGRPAVAAGLRAYYRHLVWHGELDYGAGTYLKLMMRTGVTFTMTAHAVRIIRTRAIIRARLWRATDGVIQLEELLQ